MRIVIGSLLVQAFSEVKRSLWRLLEGEGVGTVSQYVTPWLTERTGLRWHAQRERCDFTFFQSVDTTSQHACFPAL